MYLSLCFLKIEIDVNFKTMNVNQGIYMNNG